MYILRPVYGLPRVQIIPIMVLWTQTKLKLKLTVRNGIWLSRFDISLHSKYTIFFFRHIECLTLQHYCAVRMRWGKRANRKWGTAVINCSKGPLNRNIFANFSFLCSVGLSAPEDTCGRLPGGPQCHARAVYVLCWICFPGHLAERPQSVLPEWEHLDHILAGLHQ